MQNQMQQTKKKKMVKANAEKSQTFLSFRYPNGDKKKKCPSTASFINQKKANSESKKAIIGLIHYPYIVISTISIT